MLSAYDTLTIQGGGLDLGGSGFDLSGGPDASEAPAPPSTTSPWDETLPFGGPGDLAGCPPGSGVIYGTPGLWARLSGQTYTRFCQPVSDATAPVIAAETAPDALDAATQTAADALAKVKDALPSGLDLSVLLLVGVALIAVVVLRR